MCRKHLAQSPLTTILHVIPRLTVINVSFVTLMKSIGGSKGGAKDMPLPRPIFFHFQVVFGKKIV